MIALILFNMFAFSRLGFGQTQVGETIVDGVRYVLYDDGTASVENTDVSIPSNPTGLHGNINGTLTLHETVTYEGNDYSLTRLEDYAFYDCTNLTGQLVLPATLTSIGGMAFRGCHNISGPLTLPPLLTEIEPYTFYGVNFTGDFTIPDGVTTIGNYAFVSNDFSSIDVGDGVTTIGDFAFRATMASQVTFGRNVASVGEKAFQYGETDSHTIYIECKSIIPPTLGANVFAGHSNSFGSITVPCGAKNNYLDPVYGWTVNGAYELTVMEAASQDVCIDGVYYRLVCSGHTATVMNSAFLESSQGASYSGEVVIPATVDYEGITYSVTTIAPYAFYFCQSVTTVTLGSNLQSIGDDAFGWCTGIERIVCQGATPPSLNFSVAFFNINQFITLEVPCGALAAYQGSGWDVYRINMVEGGTKVEMDGLYYEIPCGDTTATVVYDVSYDTLDFVGIEDFEYGGVQYTVTAIAAGAFDGFDNLEGIDCRSNISTIGTNAFRNCTGITYFGFYHTDTPPTLGEGVFDGLRIDTLSISVPFCSQYDYSIHPVFGQFGEIQGYGSCEYNFTNAEGDKQWTNPDNWAEGEVPGETARVGIFNDCEIAADLTVGSVTIGATYVEEYSLYERLTVKNGATLTATNFIYTTGEAENFVIEDGAQVIHPNAGAKAMIQKSVTAYTPSTKDGWHLIGYSFAENDTLSEMTNLLSNDYDLYYYDEPTHYWMNQKNAANNFTELETSKGYLYANSAGITLGLKGTLRTATEMVNIPLNYTTGIDLSGFNLVGNPFAHNVTTYTGSNVVNECYRMNDLGNELIASSIGNANPLKPGEGFFVKATGDNASITFNDGAKASERSQSQSKGCITLELIQDGHIVDRFILKQEGKSLEKFTLNEGSTRLYATRDRQDWAVVPMKDKEQDVNFKPAQEGTYTLTVNVEGLELDYLHLKDKKTGADVDLLASPTLTFTAETSDNASRFRLVFNGPSIGSVSTEPFAYISNGNIIIMADAIEDAFDASLQVIDLMGRIIHSGDAMEGVSTNGMVSGVYVLRLINGDTIRTQKIVIQ